VHQKGEGGRQLLPPAREPSQRLIGPSGDSGAHAAVLYAHVISVFVGIGEESGLIGPHLHSLAAGAFQTLRNSS